MTTPFETALAALERACAGLAGGPSAEERNRLVDLHSEAMELLASAAPGRRLTTDALIRRVGELDYELRELPREERGSVIRERLGISRSYYYELKSLVREST